MPADSQAIKMTSLRAYTVTSLTLRGSHPP